LVKKIKLSGIITNTTELHQYLRYRYKYTINKLKKCVALQVNDAAVRIRLVIFESKLQLFYTQITGQTDGGRRDERGATPLTCCVG
jgi:hypothetical protein